MALWVVPGEADSLQAAALEASEASEEAVLEAEALREDFEAFKKKVCSVQKMLVSLPSISVAGYCN